MDFQILLFLLFSTVWICWFILTSNSRARRSSKLPPGPYRLPIIGNILDLGPKPHRSLAKLSRQYGPVMSLKFGTLTTIVVSTPDTAKIVLQKHDSAFSSRTVPTAVSALKHDELSVLWLPVGDRWRKLRMICKEHIVSVPRLEASQDLRRGELEKLRSYVSERCRTGRAVDIGDSGFTTALNIISGTLFSVEFARFESESSREIKGLVRAVMKCLGSPNLGDFFHVLRFADLQGIKKETRICFERLFEVFDEKLKSRDGERERNDLIETLLNLNQRGEAEFISRNEINHLFLDLFVAGTDATSGIVEWAMAELMRHPSKMSRLRDEIKNFLEENGRIQESDIPRLPYLQAVVKETFRLHPTAPLLVPHKTNSDVEINGYIVPKDTQVIVNEWAIGRDPNVWTNAYEFVPERFLNENNDVDFRGRDFELIPFGTGRRICPGLPLADRMVHQMLVTFVGNFEWKLEKEEEEMDMNEKFGLTLQKAVPLKAIPTKL